MGLLRKSYDGHSRCMIRMAQVSARIPWCNIVTLLSSGSIELREMIEIVSTLYDMEGVGGVGMTVLQCNSSDLLILPEKDTKNPEILGRN